MAVPPTQFTDEEIDRLVETFYARVRRHHRLGPIFEAAIGEDGWPAHLATLKDFWSSVLNAAAAKGPRLSRDGLVEQLEADGFGALLKTLDQQIRFARLWTATVDAASEDAREGYLQALSLHKRTKALLWQRHELEMELAHATEEGDLDAVEQILRTLQEVQFEVTRLENQEAIIDGFGPDGVSARVLDVARNAVRLQTGYVYHYAFAMMLGAAALTTWYLFGGVTR